MRAAAKLRVTISEDRLVRLPPDLPEGEAELIVLYPEANGQAPLRGAPASGSTAEPMDYFARLVARQPRPLSAEAARALDEADRGER